MLENCQNLIIGLIVIYVIHKYFLSDTVENMAPINHINTPHWKPGQKCLSPQDIINIRNTKLSCNKNVKVGCNRCGGTRLIDINNEYTADNYNPVHFNTKNHESEYTKHEGDKGVPKPDHFAGVTYY